MAICKLASIGPTAYPQEGQQRKLKFNGDNFYMIMFNTVRTVRN